MDKHIVTKVVPTDDFEVYIYFESGHVKLFDAKELIQKGVFRRLQDIEIFKNSCCVILGTLAWDLEGNRDEWSCLDLDSTVLFETCEDANEYK